jgi:hypothetical protein
MPTALCLLPPSPLYVQCSCLLPIVYSPMLTVYCPLFTNNCPLPPDHWLLLTAHWPLPLSSVYCPLPIAHYNCPLSTAHCPLATTLHTVYCSRPIVYISTAWQLLSWSLCPPCVNLSIFDLRSPRRISRCGGCTVITVGGGQWSAASGYWTVDSGQ